MSSLETVSERREQTELGVRHRRFETNKSVGTVVLSPSRHGHVDLLNDTLLGMGEQFSLQCNLSPERIFSTMKSSLSFALFFRWPVWMLE